MSQTVAELEARLAKVRAAIDAAITGKRYKIDSGTSSRELERQSLKDLHAMETNLVLQINRMGGGGVSFGMPTT